MTEVIDQKTEQKMVTLTIDNEIVSVPEGILVVDAAKMIGVDIPVFCYHPKMEPVGMCRVCLVDIGMPERNDVARLMQKQGCQTFGTCDVGME